MLLRYQFTNNPKTPSYIVQKKFNRYQLHHIEVGLKMDKSGEKSLIPPQESDRINVIYKQIWTILKKIDSVI